MNEEPLISGYLDETLTPEQSAELEVWIKADQDNAKQFADAVYLDERLQAEMNLKLLTETADEKVAPPDSTRGNWWNFAALAACLMVAFAFWWQLGTKQNAPSFATVVQLVDATWVEGKSVSVGARISKGLLQLEAGIAHLRFDSGVEVTLQGPAEFEISSVDVTRLRTGLLVANVPPGAEGFRVATPTAQVVDLGTAFGIEQRADGSSKVSVFEGEVEVASQKSRGKRLLTEGNAVRLGSDGSVSEAEFSSAPFERLWPTASGVTGSSDNFRFAPPWPRRLRLVRSDTEIFVVPEGQATRLEKPCPIDITGPDSAESAIPAGRRVRSYLLQFHPDDQEPNENGGKLKRIEGTITFERPIIGLILKSETLKKTDGFFTVRGGRGPSSPRALGQGPPGLADVVSLSEDRLTLTLKLVVFGRLSDHLRVIVDAPLPGGGMR